MKNILFLFFAAGILSASVRAQSTADSIQAKYKLIPMPEAYTIEKAFPVLGTYKLNSTTDNNAVTISLDSSNKGIVWIDGLPEGRMKAYLKVAPATYRIIAQRTSTGREIPEGTLIFTPDNNTLNISLGAPFNDTDPAGIFSSTNVTASTDAAPVEAPAKVKVKTKNGTVKTKNRVQFYTAVKSSAQSTSNSSTSSINQ